MSNHSQTTPAIYLSGNDLERLYSIANNFLENNDTPTSILRLNNWFKAHPAAKNNKLTKNIYARLSLAQNGTGLQGLALAVHQFAQNYESLQRLNKRNEESTIDENERYKTAIDDAREKFRHIGKSSSSMREVLEMAVLKSKKLRKQYWSNTHVIDATNGIEALLNCCIQCIDINQIDAQAAEDELKLENINP